VTRAKATHWIETWTFRLGNRRHHNVPRRVLDAQVSTEST
jgi:hypothetical protein